MRAFDRVARIAFCLIVGMLLVGAGGVFPIAGVVANAVLVTVVALIGPGRWRRWAGRIPLVGRVVAGLARVGEYYAEHPPRSLFYYVLYPLLMPYWLIVSKARRELLLFRGFNIIALLLLVGGAAVQYLRLWRPEIGFDLFAGTWVGIFILQILFTMMFVMPLVTTIVGFHHERRPGLLALAMVLLVAGAAVATISRHDNPAIRTETQMRTRYRTEAVPERADAVMYAAVAAASEALEPATEDGFVVGAPLARARAALRSLYKHDEASTFELYWVGAERDVLVILAPVGRNRPYLWRAATRAGAPVLDPSRFPPIVRVRVGVR